jgi:carbon monoxide dehydrogenase subunit G
VQLEHSFTVPVGIDEAWKVLLDIERVAPCMPGAALDSVDGDEFTGTVKVKLGPINLTYKGRASFVEKDEAAHRAVIDARGRDARGNGTAAARVTATLADAGESTDVQVNTELDITGKPAQFGRGVMVDVGNKLIGRFAESLAGTLQAGEPPAAQPATAAAGPAAAESDSATAEADVASTADATTPAAAAVPAEPELAAEPTAPTTTAAIGEAVAENGHAADQPRVPQPEVEPINLLEHAGPAVAKRLAPLVLALLVVLIALRRLSRRRT